MEECALIIDYIEETCNHLGKNIAVRDEGTNEQITYQELAEKYSIISRQIIRRINYDTHEDFPPIIAIITQRNMASIIGTLAILHAQCIFLPIDPDLPEICQIQILQHSKCELVIVDDENMKKIRTYPLAILPPAIILDRNGNLKDLSPCETYRFRNFPVRKDPLLYVIYKNDEEGGKAQGVIVSNSGILNVLKYFISYLQLKENDKILSLMPLSCDAAIIEIFSPLLIGATIVLGSPSTTEDPRRLIRVVEENQITFLQGTIRMFEALLDNDWEGSKKLQLMIAIGGGSGGYSTSSNASSSEGSMLLEELKLPSRLYGLVKKCRQIYTVYGSSETSIWSSCHWLENDIEPKLPEALIKSLLPPNIPTTQYYLGQPIHHTQFYVLNKRLQPVKPGQLGELYIGGKGLAKGYLYDNNLTKTKFIKHPFQKRGKLFKTGICCLKIRNNELNHWEYVCINGLNPDVIFQEGLLASTIDWYRSVSYDLSSWTASLFSPDPTSKFSFPSFTSAKPVIPVGDSNAADLPKANISSFTSVTTQATDQTQATNMAVQGNKAEDASSTANNNSQLMTRNRRRSSVLKKALIIPAGHFYHYSSSALAKQEEEQFLQQKRLEENDAFNPAVKVKTVQIREEVIEEVQKEEDDEEEEEEEEDTDHPNEEVERNEQVESNDITPPAGMEKSPSFKRQRQSTFVFTPSPFSRANSIKTPSSVVLSPDQFGSTQTNFSLDSPLSLPHQRSNKQLVA